MNLLQGFREDLVAILISGAYVLAVIAVAEVLRRRGMAREHTRKIVHVAVGMWIIPTYLLFEHRFWAVVPAASFVVINGLSWQYGWMRSTEGERRNIGTVFFPLSTALALSLFWTPPWPVVGASAIMVMAWGDAAAAIVGRKYGRTHYVVLDHERSAEGSLAMLLASTAAILVSFAAFGAPIDGGVLAAALLAAGLATVVEAVCPFGLDNLLIPATVATTLYFTRAGLWG